MAQAKDVLLRQQIATESKLGASYSSLAQRYSVSYNTVRAVCKSYEEYGEQGLVPRYSNCGRRAASGAERSFRLVRLLKHLHPGWGVAFILVRIGGDYPGLSLQSERHYQRRLANGGGKSPKPQLPPAPPAEPSRSPHDTWQIDAKERIGMVDGQQRCFLNITDEKPLACSRPRVFPQGRINQVPLSEVRALLLEQFEQWGMPLAIRTDNGDPFGVPTRDVIPIMSLWLLAWGITPILNRPRRPQDNAKVESNQGTVSRWAEVYKCQSLEQMQERLDAACALQRDHFLVKRIGKPLEAKYSRTSIRSNGHLKRQPSTNKRPTDTWPKPYTPEK